MVLAFSLILAAEIAFLIAFNQNDKPTVNQESNSELVNKNQYTVTFYSNDGTVLKIDSVENEMAANPPAQPQMLYGTVFRSWDADIASVTNNLEVYPICENANGKLNIFAIEGSYGKSGGTVIVPFRLCGDVCVAAFDITVSYDSNALELLSVSEDDAVIYNDKHPGVINLNYVSTDNTVTDVDICFLEFLIKSPSGHIPITLEMHSIYACQDTLESNNDALYVPEYSTINGTVYVLPKGE